MLKDKKVFISGGNGVIGRELVSQLHEQGAIIFVGDLKPRPIDWPKEIIYRQGDLNYITMDELCPFKPEYYFHLAATFERSTETYDFWGENFHHNIKLSNHLMTLLKDSCNLKRIVFASSYLIYDPVLYTFDKPAQTAYRLNEKDNIYPRNLTGIAKLLLEIELRFLDEFKGEKYSTVSARIFRVYGKHSRDVISRFIRSLIKGETLEVYRTEGMFDYIYAGDVAEGLIRLAEKNDITGVINLGIDNARRVQDILDILKKYFPKMKTTEIKSDISYEASQANMDKFIKHIGWKPKTQLEKGIPLLIQNKIDYPYKENDDVAKCNLLITSIAKKVPMLKSIKKASKKFDKIVKIFGGDANKDCIGKYFVDKFWEMPRDINLSFNEIMNYCKENNINGIIPTRDGELLFWAKHKNRLNEKRINVMVSDFDVVESCVDKLLFYQKSDNMGYPAIPTFLSPEDIDSILFVVKERFGAGARKIGLGLTIDQSIDHAKKLNHPVFQPFIKGYETSVDLYVSRTGNVKGIIIRRRDLIFRGESQVTTTIRNKRLEELCTKFAKDFNLYGHAVMQIIIDDKESFHIIECNNRFGGASTISLEAGLDSFFWFLLETKEVDISEYPFYRLKHEIKQVRFSQDMILHDPYI